MASEKWFNITFLGKKLIFVIIQLKRNILKQQHRSLNSIMVLVGFHSSCCITHELATKTLDTRFVQLSQACKASIIVQKSASINQAEHPAYSIMLSSERDCWFRKKGYTQFNWLSTQPFERWAISFLLWLATCTDITSINISLPRGVYFMVREKQQWSNSGKCKLVNYFSAWLYPNMTINLALLTISRCWLFGITFEYANSYPCNFSIP